MAPDGRVEVALEFKYEPAHDRSDIPSEKFPVVDWGNEGVAKDIERVRRFVEEGRAGIARSYFIDEGGAFRHRELHPGSHWAHWGGEWWLLVAEARRE